jgi:gliding motility-associated-like protein
VGTDTVSWSNDICFNFEPILYIPNAFTPNDDGLNDQFVLSGGALKTIDFKIFNRWGELLFQSDNLKSFWNGMYKNKAQPQGVYMYSCTYTDFRGKLYSTKGTITLLK